MRIVFMGTPAFAVPALAALADAGHEIAAVYTQPPRPGGRRGRELTRSPVQRAAEARDIPVRCPVSLRNAEAQAEFAAWEADIAVVAAYGLILPPPVLDAPKLGCLNLHASLLPRWRGAAPVQRAIMAGDEETGVCIMRMEAGLDTGPVLATTRTTIDGKTAGALTAELADLGARLIVEVLDDLAVFAETPQPEHGVTYAAKLDKAEARLDFSQPAAMVARQVQAFAPISGAFFELAGERFKVLAVNVVSPSEGRDLGRLQTERQDDRGPSLRWEAGTVIDDHLTIACVDGAVRPTLVQRAGRPVMEVDAFLRGFSVPAGTVLG